MRKHNFIGLHSIQLHRFRVWQNLPRDMGKIAQEELQRVKNGVVAADPHIQGYFGLVFISVVYENRSVRHYLLKYFSNNLAPCLSSRTLHQWEGNSSAMTFEWTILVDLRSPPFLKSLSPRSLNLPQLGTVVRICRKKQTGCGMRANGGHN